jgi:membrane-associated protease RseP (regulator of RpoE activity)
VSTPLPLGGDGSAPVVRWVWPDPRRRPALPVPTLRELAPHLLLFAATAASVWNIGRDFGPGGGVRLALGLLSILFAHEMGHYLACRYYRVDATPPYFIPSPWIPLGLTLWVPLSFVGTFGAVIRIRGAIPNRKALFDIGIAGPLAGFAVCLPVLALGLAETTLQPASADAGGIYLGEPLLMVWLAELLAGPAGEGMTRVLGPLGLAAWFGLLVTALNLLPIGQLDGGHVSYALLRTRALRISQLGSWVCLALTWFGPNWLIWWGLLRVLGRRHPPTLDDASPVGRTRVAVGLLGAAVFAVCFVPDPVVWSWSDFFEAVW